jgi:peptidoglycan/xylan/chitin deacetylase (PgdA/CDA1 family)
MDKRVLRERMRKKKRQMMIRRYTRLASYVIAAILVLVFVIRGIILPIAGYFSGGENGDVQEVQAQVSEADPNEAVRRPLKGQGDVSKVSDLTPGWHDSDEGRWYQNADGTYFADGFQEIDGVEYSFDENGYIQTGWVTKGSNDYYFNEDGSYNPDKKRPMVALTFDDGPGPYTSKLLDCLEEYDAHATFFMLGQNVEYYPDEVKRMVELGCELGNHSWNHDNMYEVESSEGISAVADDFASADNALIAAAGQAATVARAPYGNGNTEIYEAVGKPFFMWSLDTEDWSLLNVDADYAAVMDSDALGDGTIVLMHDIHEQSVDAAIRLIPDLIAKGYRLVTVSEMAEAKGVTLQNTSYNNFWQSNLDAGMIAGYVGNDSSDLTDDGSDETVSDGDGDVSDGDDYSDDEVDDGDYEDED